MTYDPVLFKMTLAFFVPGLPAPQGSKNPFGGEVCKGVKPWRQDIAWFAKEAAAKIGWRRPSGPVAIDYQFYFPATKAALKSRAVYKTSAPDIDKLQRAVNDALGKRMAGVIEDDAQIASAKALKLYGGYAGVQIEIRAL